MKKLLCIALSLVLLTGCTAAPAQTTGPAAGEVLIELSDQGVTFDGEGVHTANDIIYYEEGHDESYGEGEAWQAHSAEEAAAHTVVHISQPGTYRITGSLSAGQIAVDLGEEAKDDPAAAVVLILDNADITCTVAPAVIFYNVYESGAADGPAGAHVLLAKDSENHVAGSHVAKIYEPGTEDKLHKYDGAFYSRMSMKLGGTGKLHIEADNEGLDSEMHLTIDGGDISIASGNDGINTNEDGVSVTTINGGHLRITVTGTTGEGDGIDSNGWLIINGGTVEAFACGTSGDAGIDSDMGISINGGTVYAAGNMLDRIEGLSQTHLVFTFAQTQQSAVYTLKAPDGTVAAEVTPANPFQILIFSAPELAEGNYTLWSGDTQFEGMAGQGGGPGGHFGGAQIIERPEWPGKGEGGDVEIPPQPTNPVVTHGTVQQPATGDEQPADMPVAQFPEGSQGQMPVPPIPQEGENMPMPQLPGGVTPPADGFQGKPGMTILTGVLSTDFPVTTGANYYMNVKPVE